MSTEYYPRTSLTGGGAGALDQLASANLDTDDVALVTTSTKFYVYHYDGTSAAAESSPDVIAPDDIGVGNGRWLLVSMIDNTAYGAGWNGVSNRVPTQDAVYDEMEKKADFATAAVLGTL